MHGLAVLEHHEVRDVDDVVDGPLAGLLQGAPEPLRGRPDPDPLYQTRGIPWAQVGVLDLDGHPAGYERPVLRVGGIGLCDLRAGDGPDLPRYPQNRQAVRPVRRHLGVQYRVAQHVHERSAHGHIVVQHEDAAVVFAETQLALRAHHAGRQDAPDLRGLQGLDLARPVAAQHRALAGEGDLLSGRDVRSAADDSGRLAVAQVDRGQAKPVGVRVRVHLQDIPDEHLVAVPASPGLLDRADLRSGHGEPVGKLTRWEVYRDIPLEP